MTTFKVVVKLVEVFTGNEKSQTIFEALRMLQNLYNFIQNYPKAVEYFTTSEKS